MRISTLSQESFACYVKACAPPPVGRGGSTKEGYMARKEAVRRLALAQSIDKEVTAKVKAVAESIDAVSVGLKFRVKGLGSLTRKIHDKALEKGLTISESGERIGDSLRYTMVIHSKRYGPSIRQAMKAFQKAGFEIPEMEKETHWPRGDAYNGAHIQLVHPSGIKIEMQFHTTGSWAAKNKTHKMYEEARQRDTTPERKRQLVIDMVRIADSVRRPVGALAKYLGRQVYRPPEGV